MGHNYFIKYYNTFKTKSVDECITSIEKPQATDRQRVLGAKRIFNEDLHREALAIIALTGKADTGNKQLNCLLRNTMTR